MEENVDEAKRVVVFRLYSEGASGRNMEQQPITVEENVDEAQRIEVFRLYSKDFSRRNIKLYYDSYEYEYGDGFYPVTENISPCTTEINISFTIYVEYNNIFWKQTNDKYKPIYGLDGDQRELLLKQLNNLSIKKAVGIKNKMGTTI